MIECELGDRDCELAVSNLRKVRKSAVEARWRSGDVEDCKSAAAPASRPIVRSLPALFRPPDSVGFGSDCELSFYFPRRSSSRSTASRMKAVRSSSCFSADAIRVNVSAGNGATHLSGYSILRPTRGAVSHMSFRAKAELFRICGIARITHMRYLSHMAYGGKTA